MNDKLLATKAAINAAIDILVITKGTNAVDVFRVLDLIALLTAVAKDLTLTAINEAAS